MLSREGEKISSHPASTCLKTTSRVLPYHFTIEGKGATVQIGCYPDISMDTFQDIYIWLFVKRFYAKYGEGHSMLWPSSL